MKIKQAKNRYESIWPNSKLNQVLKISIFFFLFFGSGFALSHFDILSIVKKEAFTSYHYIRYLVNERSKPTDKLFIDIDHKNYQKLAYNVKEAQRIGYLLNDNKEYVSATLNYNGSSYKSKVRLKGDMNDHRENGFWSFRIKIKGDKYPFRMKEFSIQKPHTRNYLYEWFMSRLFKAEDILTTRYSFIKIILNGKDMGLYALEEHFDKILLEYNKRQEGPIMKYDESLLWENRIKLYGGGDMRSNFEGGYVHNITAFNIKKIEKSEGLSKQYEHGKSLLEDWRSGKKKTSEVFDVNRLAKYFALLDLSASQHSEFWHNRRFYYNPITTKLEPIAFDMRSNAITSELLIETDDTFSLHSDIKDYFKDPIFTNLYINELKRISEATYFDSIFKELEEDFEYNRSLLLTEYPQAIFNKKYFYRNQKYIRSILYPPKSISAYHKTSSDTSITISIGNLTPIPIEVSHISYKDKILPLIDNNNSIVKANQYKNPVYYQNISFALREDLLKINKNIIDSITIHFKRTGLVDKQAEKISIENFPKKKNIENECSKNQSNIDDINFISINEKEKKITIKKGSWLISENITIPKGYKFYVNEGTTLDFSKEANIISYSTAYFKGEKNSPIILKSDDSSGQGIVIIEADQVSKFEYVIFDNLSNLSCGNWELRGATAFYESDVNISNCTFKNNRSEDALNIIRSYFNITNSKFENISSDAFDSDFSDGAIAGINFFKIGNDAIDVSTSNINISNIHIKETGDKGLSAGENSFVKVNNFKVANANIGIASKDLSRVELNDVTISDSNIGFSIFQKKPEYGGAYLNVKNLKLTNVETEYSLEKGSELLIDNISYNPL